jgi:ATP-binding cassette, subfamily B, bacterial
MSLLSDLRRAGRLTAYRPKHFYGGSLVWVGLFIFPLVPGTLFALAFRELQAHGTSGRFFALNAIVFVANAAFLTLHVLGVQPYHQGYMAAVSLVQTNLMHAQVSSGGPDAGVRTMSPAKVVSTLRDDPRDLVGIMDTMIDIAGVGTFSIVAFIVLLRVHVLAAIVGVLPLTLLTLLNRWLGNKVRRARGRQRAATTEVTGFLGSALSAAVTIKLFGATDAVLTRFAALGTKRAKAAVTDQVLSESLFTVTDAASDFCLGLALLVAALGVASHRLDAGGVTLFAAYLADLAWLPRRLAILLVGHRRFEVAWSRMTALLPDGKADGLIAHRVAPIVGGGPIAPPAPLPLQPLAVLELRGVTIAERGLRDINLTVRRGQIAIITGPVAAGKSSLLQAVLGLLALDSGSVLWNGSVVADRAAFFIPPHCAFVPQTPVLFADSLLDNLLLDTLSSPDVLASALRQSAFEEDVAGFGDGLATRIGARGIRLSGGQLQRAAAARAFLRQTELVILDDLTSALDVETELLLWERLRAAGVTVLAASTRPAALAQADLILDLSA